MSKENSPVVSTAEVPIDAIAVEIEAEAVLPKGEPDIELEAEETAEVGDSVENITTDSEIPVSRIESGTKIDRAPSWAITNLPKRSAVNFIVKKTDEQKDALELVFQQSILAILSSLDIPSTKLAVDRISDLALEYLHSLTYNLRKLIEIQRRRRPALKDLTLLMKQHNLKMIDLHDEYRRSNKKIVNDKALKAAIAKISANTDQIIEAKSNPNFEVDESDPSAPLFHNETFEILDLIPSTTRLRFPKIFPQLPPDYTYKTTADFNKLEDNPRIIREKLIEESRYGEKALQNLLNGHSNGQSNFGSDDDDAENPLGDDEQAFEEQKVISQEQPQLSHESGLLEQLPKTTVTVPNSAKPRAFDIEAFAKHRLSILEARRKKAEAEIQQRTEMPIYKISYELGSYTQKPPLKMKDDSISTLIHGYLLAEYEQTAKNITLAKRRKMIKLKQDNAKRQKLLAQQELERQEHGIEHTFEFGTGDGHDGDGDDDEIEDFNFEFDEDLQAPEVTSATDQVRIRETDDIEVEEATNQMEAAASPNLSGSIAKLKTPEEVEVAPVELESDLNEAPIMPQPVYESEAIVKQEEDVFSASVSPHEGPINDEPTSIAKDGEGEDDDDEWDDNIFEEI